jgi:hypothetical protein
MKKQKKEIEDSYFKWEGCPITGMNISEANRLAERHRKGKKKEKRNKQQ